MGLFVDFATGVENFFTSEPKEWELLGYESYEDWWNASKPDINMYKSPIYPGGFDRDSYEQDFSDWISKRPNQSGSGE